MQSFAIHVKVKLKKKNALWESILLSKTLIMKLEVWSFIWAENSIATVWKAMSECKGNILNFSSDFFRMLVSENPIDVQFISCEQFLTATLSSSRCRPIFYSTCVARLKFSRSFCCGHVSCRFFPLTTPTIILFIFHSSLVCIIHNVCRLDLPSEFNYHRE